jgi:hypothetical protein
MPCAASRSEIFAVVAPRVCEMLATPHASSCSSAASATGSSAKFERSPMSKRRAFGSSASS